MKKTKNFRGLLLALCLSAAACSVAAQEAQATATLRFDLSGSKRTADGHVAVSPTDSYDAARGYGYDFGTAPQKGSSTPLFFSVALPDGNYRVTLHIGSKRQAGNTTVRCESRRLLASRVATRKGEIRELTFTLNKRSPRISDSERVKIKQREQSKLDWDEKLTFEFNGPAPCVQSVSIEPEGEGVTTLFLCGNSTVVDQDEEPWASWGQMVTGFFDEQVCIANYAESGESAGSFIAAGRLKKALSQIKPGDYLLMEFGHNDQKQQGPGKGAFYSFATNLKMFIDEARARGAHPVLITPTQRRSFDAQGKIADTHRDYPDAVRWVAEREGVPLIDLHRVTRTLYEAWGDEESKHAFVHYPANSYPGQSKALSDNTHFNPFGAYQIARCVVEGMKQAGLSTITQHLNTAYTPIDVTAPDDWRQFTWDESPFVDIQKPDGN